MTRDIHLPTSARRWCHPCYRMPWIIAGLATLAFLWAGLLLAEAGMTDRRVAFVEGWAIFSVEQNPLGLAEGRRVFPPLPQWLTALVAVLGLDYPARWLSALAGGFIVWFFFCFTGTLERRRGLRGLLLCLICWTVVFQAGLWAGATGGSGRMILWAALLPAIGLLGRYLLEMERFVQARSQGRLSAWMEGDGYLQGRLHFLWGAALLFAVAACAQPWLGLMGLLGWLPLAWLLLPPGERGKHAKVFTLWLLVFTPTLAALIGLAYLNWVFSGDPLLSFRHARELLLLIDPGAAISSHQIAWRGAGLSALSTLTLGLAISAPILLYLLFRMGNPGLALLFTVPWLVEAWTLDQGHQLFEATSFGFGQLSAILCLLLAARFGKITPWEQWLCAAILVGVTPLGWWQLATSPQPSDQALVRLLNGDKMAGENHRLAMFLQKRPDLWPVIADERVAAPLMAELGTSRAFLNTGSQGYSTAMFQNQPTYRAVLAGDPSHPVPGGLATDDAWVRLRLVEPEIQHKPVALPSGSPALLWRRMEKATP